MIKKQESKKMQIELVNENAFFCTEEEFSKNEIGCTIFKDGHSINIPWTSILWFRIDD